MSNFKNNTMLAIAAKLSSEFQQEQGYILLDWMKNDLPKELQQLQDATGQELSCAQLLSLTTLYFRGPSGSYLHWEVLGGSPTIVGSAGRYVWHLLDRGGQLEVRVFHPYVLPYAGDYLRMGRDLLVPSCEEETPEDGRFRPQDLARALFLGQVAWGVNPGERQMPHWHRDALWCGSSMWSPETTEIVARFEEGILQGLMLPDYDPAE